MPTVYGEKIVIRLLDKSGQMLSKEAIGLEGKDLEQLQRAAEKHQRRDSAGGSHRFR